MTDPSDLAPHATKVFDELITTLGEVRDGYALSAERFDDPIDVAEAYRYVGQVLSAASEMFWEGDPDHPRFASIVSPARKLQGDNPDAIYHFARVRGDRSYRVRGRLDRQCYTSFTVHGRADDGAMAGPLLGDVNHRDLEIAADGSYELVFGAEPPGSGNFLALDRAAYTIIVRSYFQLPVSVQNDASAHVEIDIECVDEVPPPAPLRDEVIAERMADGVAFLRQATLGQGLPSVESPVPFVSNTPNEVATPFSFRDTGLPVPGAADIFYSQGKWDLGPDDALVMTGTLPPGLFANVMLWNRHMQTLDYRNRRTALNAEQITFEDDGSYRIVVAHRDPGVANWLDTEGHARGTIFWRFLLPDEDPARPVCEVVTLD